MPPTSDSSDSIFPPFPEDMARVLIKKVLSTAKISPVALPTLRPLPPSTIGGLVTTTGEEFVSLSGYAFTLSATSTSLSNPVTVAPPIVEKCAIDEALKENDSLIHSLTSEIKSLISDTSKINSPTAQEPSLFAQQRSESITLRELKSTRKKLTDESLLKVFSLYNFFCADGKCRSLLEIMRERAHSLDLPPLPTSKQEYLPPSGTGDCAEIKLLSHCFRLGLTPLSLAVAKIPFKTFDPKKSPSHSKKKHEDGKIEWLPPCRSRCALILPSILGLKIVYRDKDIIVIDKVSGLLSVPGRFESDCVVTRLKRLFPATIPQPAVHRLDMETSGLLVLAFNENSHRTLSEAFERREVQKAYTALLEGDLLNCSEYTDVHSPQSTPHQTLPVSGTITLKHRVDINNRPHQIVDPVNGKEAITNFKITKVEKLYGRKVSRVIFYPLTGRTHQLRVAARYALNHPIVGDTLYGMEGGKPSDTASIESRKNTPNPSRLYLHAHYLAFRSPTTGENLEFFSPAPF